MGGGKWVSVQICFDAAWDITVHCKPAESS